MYHYSSQHVDSGSPKAMLGMASLLHGSRYDPVYLATGEGPLVDAFARQNVEIVRGDVRSVSLRRPLSGMRRLMEQSAMLRRHKVDLLHVNEFGWNQDIVLAARLRGVPVILHAHNPVDIGRRNLNRFAASKILVVSEAHKKAVEGYHRIHKKCEVMYNFVDVDAMGRGRDIRSSLGLCEQDIVLGTVGHVSWGKGTDVLLDAARELLGKWNRLAVLVVGPFRRGEEKFGETLKEKVEQGPLKGRVRFLGSRTDIADILASIDAFVFPSRGETFGIAVIEAMAAGVPVIASKVGGIPEIINSGDVGRTVETISGKAFAEAVNQVLERDDRGREMGERGRRSLDGRFDRQTAATKLRDVYDRVLRNEA